MTGHLTHGDHLLLAGLVLLLLGAVLVWAAWAAHRERAAERAWEKHVQEAFDLAAAHHAGLIVLPTPDLASFGAALLERETTAFRRDLDAWGQA